MGNYEQLKKAIGDVITSNGNQEITGKVMRETLWGIINTIAKGAIFAGVATPDTAPGTPDENVFYLAGPGVYPNFGGANVTGISVFRNVGNSWKATTILEVAQTPGDGENTVMSQKIVSEGIGENKRGITQNAVFLYEKDLNGDYAGICSNNIYKGTIRKSTADRDAYVVKVLPDTLYKIDCNNYQFGNESVLLYSDYPADNTYIEIVRFYKNNKAFLTKNAKYVLINIDKRTTDAYCKMTALRTIDNDKIKKNALQRNNLNFGLANKPECSEILMPIGAFCGNVNTGAISYDTWEYDGYAFELPNNHKGALFLKGVSEYAFGKGASIQCYSGAPSADTSLGYVSVGGNGEITVKDGTKVIIISVKITSLKNDVVTMSYTQEEKTNNPLLEGKTLFSLCDSFGEGGTWQRKLADLGGMEFNQSLNFNHTLPISYGGSKTGPTGEVCGMQRAKNLLQLKEKGQKIDYLIVENVNDIDYAYNPVGTIKDKAWFNEQEIAVAQIFNTREEAENYFTNNIVAILQGKPKKSGTAILLPYKVDGKATQLKVKNKATKNGTIYVIKGQQKFGIEVTTTMSAADIIQKMRAYNYGPGWTDTVIADDTIVIGFYTTTTTKIATDVGDTGVIIEEMQVDNIASAQKLYYGDDIGTDWTNTASWVGKVSLYAMYSGLLNYLCSKFKDTKIYWFIPTYWGDNVDNNPFIKADGSVDWDKYDKNYASSARIFEIQKDICRRYGIPVLDVRAECGINVQNVAEFYPNNNVHPLEKGYYRWAETMFRLLQ